MVGLTEFLPISSSAHLAVVPVLLGWARSGARSLTAALLALAESIGSRRRSLAELRVVDAGLVGLAQAFAVVQGEAGVFVQALRGSTPAPGSTGSTAKASAPTSRSLRRRLQAPRTGSFQRKPASLARWRSA